jgi:hypothetical protein
VEADVLRIFHLPAGGDISARFQLLELDDFRKFGRDVIDERADR